ncbi:MAG: NAD(P)/FAD-dependent oxidoreductase [Alphaproteobacteria bacterium]|nr:NAD(P)/FAD-dependent oxidoreductase [Alphaproteobacteria bacterium]
MSDTALQDPGGPIPSSGSALDYDVVIVGAGISGMYQLHKLRGLGFKVLVLEAGTGVGGTWYWNRYPGARFDSESYSYAYSFDPELLAAWNWSEHFAAQPETERYLNFVADKLDLRRDIRFSSRVAAAHYEDAGRAWTVTLDSGERYRCRFMITAIGPLSAPTMPRIPGIEDFKGQSFHTGLWPKEPVSFEGKRVAVVGTGATGVQTIQEVAKTAKTLTVFQRRPNWCAPLHNAKISPEEQPALKARYPEIFQRCRETFACFLHTPDPRSALEVSDTEREAFWERRYNEPGFGIWQGNFRDVMIDRTANRMLSDFVARKIRERVKDPKTAELLIPKDHGFGTRRVPLETKYYEVFNQPNVRLVDALSTPIERITPAGLETGEEAFEFDMIIYATGFDAITGSFDRIDIRGEGGKTLKERWKGGPETFLGMMVEGFPNMFMLVGPHTALGNIPRSIEYNVEWVADVMRHMRDRDITYATTTPEAVAGWTETVRKAGEGLLSNEVDSWMTGVNRNAGKTERILARYSGSAVAYRARCDAVAAAGYSEIRFD